jgi:phage FluMu protein Com
LSSNNTISELIPDQIIVGEHLYSDAINIVLAIAEHELLIFDQDLSHGDFASKQKFELFQMFLNKSPTNQLTIILQNTAYLKRKCPRLLDLLTIYSHKMTIYETSASTKQAKDCFILADDKNYVKRIHIDQARFRFGLNDIATVNLLTTRFKELLEATDDVVTNSKLGL